MLKMKKKPAMNAVALSIVSIVFLVAGLALAQGPGQGMGRCNGKPGMGGRGPGQVMACDENGEFNNFDHFDHMAVRLELSDEQKEAIEKLHEENRADNLALRKDMMRLRNELQGEMMKDDPSEKTALGISAQMNDIRGELQANRLKTRLAVRKQLTPEQRDMMLMIGGPGQGKKGGFHGQKGHHGKPGKDCHSGGGGFQRNCR